MMTGTETQVKWATDIIEKLVVKCDKLLENAFDYEGSVTKAEKCGYTVKQVEDVKAGLIAWEDAKEIIDNRFIEITSLIEKFEVIEIEVTEEIIEQLKSNEKTVKRILKIADKNDKEYAERICCNVASVLNLSYKQAVVVVNKVIEGGLL